MVAVVVVEPGVMKVLQLLVDREVLVEQVAVALEIAEMIHPRMVELPVAVREETLEVFKARLVLRELAVQVLVVQMVQ